MRNSQRPSDCLSAKTIHVLSSFFIFMLPYGFRLNRCSILLHTPYCMVYCTNTTSSSFNLPTQSFARLLSRQGRCWSHLPLCLPCPCLLSHAFGCSSVRLGVIKGGLPLLCITCFCQPVRELVIGDRQDVRATRIASRHGHCYHHGRKKSPH